MAKELRHISQEPSTSVDTRTAEFMATARGQLSKHSSTSENGRTTRCTAKALVPTAMEPNTSANLGTAYGIRYGDGIVYLANGNRVVGEFPMIGARKIQKFLIRDQFLEGQINPYH